MIIQGVSYLSDFEAKKAIMATAARLCQRGWMLAGDGALSVRVGPNAIWISVAGADKANLTQDKLIRIDLNGRQTATNKPKPLGDDIQAQLRIYKENDRVRSIVHAYPISAIELGVMNMGAEAVNYTPALKKLGRIRLTDALMTEQAISDAALLSKNDNGILIKGDGCMMWGETPQEAADYIELLDYYCQVQKALGGSGAMNPRPQPRPSYMQYGTAGYLPSGNVQFIPRCTAECSACGNVSCPDRRNGFSANVASGSTYAAHAYAAAAAAVCTDGQDKHCTGSCEHCKDNACSARCSTCAGKAEQDTLSVNGYGDTYAGLDKALSGCGQSGYGQTGESSTHIGSLPKGMTGLIKPGEPLPPIEADIPTAATEPSDTAEHSQKVQQASGFMEHKSPAVNKQRIISELARHYIGN